MVGLGGRKGEWFWVVKRGGFGCENAEGLRKGKGEVFWVRKRGGIRV
jgi:hypothetical protein